MFTAVSLFAIWMANSVPTSGRHNTILRGGIGRSLCIANTIHHCREDGGNLFMSIGTRRAARVCVCLFYEVSIVS